MGWWAVRSRVAMDCARRGFGCVVVVCEFRTNGRSRRFGERYPTCQKLFMRGFRFRPTKPSSPTHARKNLWYPREGEWHKATTGTSLKMFLKRSVDCRMGCFLRSRSWMLYGFGYLYLWWPVYSLLRLGFMIISRYLFCSDDLFFNEQEVIIYSLTSWSRTTLRGAPPFHLSKFNNACLWKEDYLMGVKDLDLAL